MFPEIQNAFDGWEIPLTFIRVTQTIRNNQVIEAEEIIFFEGVFQPFSAQDLMVKPIGERSWQWWMIHSRIPIPLVTGDKIKYEGENCKVMKVQNYKINGYYQYDVVRNYEAAS